MMPSFVVDLPGGGGKRLASTYESYDRKTGRSSFKAPNSHMKGVDGEERLWEYWDPIWSLEDEEGEGLRRSATG